MKRKLVQLATLVEDLGELTDEIVRDAWAAQVRNEIDLERTDQRKVKVFFRLLFL